MVARSVKNPRAPCLNDLDEHGVAALLGAMSHGSIKVAMALIAAGCDLKRSVDQRSAITVAIDDGLDEVALAMIRRSVSNPRSSCIDESDDQGKQALLLAIEKGRDEVALGLIEGGAALDCAWEGCSALAWAIIHKQQKVAVAMIKAMARKNISWMEQTDTEGTDPATLAIRAGQVMTLQALVAHGLDPENTTVGEQSVADFLEKADQSQSVSMDQEARPSRLGLQEMAELARKKLREATALAQSAKERDVKAKVSERSKGESKGPRSSFGL
jgi:ankyrin repeat protein